MNSIRKHMTSPPKEAKEAERWMEKEVWWAVEQGEGATGCHRKHRPYVERGAIVTSTHTHARLIYSPLSGFHRCLGKAAGNWIQSLLTGSRRSCVGPGALWRTEMHCHFFRRKLEACLIWLNLFPFLRCRFCYPCRLRVSGARSR